jgi:hypothetical protein
LIQQTTDPTMWFNAPFIPDDASLPSTYVPPEMIETTDSTFAVGVEEEEMEEEEKLIQDLAHSDNAKVDAALDALSLDLDKEEEKCNTVAAWGGCAALVRLLKDRLKKAMKKIPQCDRVTELHELAELETIEKTLCVLVGLSSRTDTCRVVIATVGGVEAVVTAMQALPMCTVVQERGCCALHNLTWSSIGKKRAVESGGIEVLLATVTTHLNSAKVCEHACLALVNIVRDSKENTGLLITMGGATVVAKVRTKWPNDDNLQTKVKSMAHLIAVEMDAWARNERYY